MILSFHDSVTQGSWGMAAWTIQVAELFMLWVKKFKSDLQRVHKAAQRKGFLQCCTQSNLSFVSKATAAMTHTQPSDY